MSRIQKPFYCTELGALFLGNAFQILDAGLMNKLKGKINLIITSPPFPLNTKKKYGNLQGEEYKEWFIGLGPILEQLLTDDGSVVMEIGNAWESDRPVQSLLHLECLLGLVNNSNLRLIQEFICYNPSKLPSPAQWVTVNRIRTVDSYTHVWWMAKSDFPKADNSKVLRPYSKSMKALLKKGSFNSGKRPSQHVISKDGFLKNHGGSIAHNFFELDAIDENRDVRLPFNALSFANTSSNDEYFRKCRESGMAPHPARMNEGLVDFFIRFLTEEEDVVLDPFGGSNTTGSVAERLNRRWISFEINEDYAHQSKLRFTETSNTL